MAALFAAAMFATPAMAQEFHAESAPSGAYVEAAPGPAYAAAPDAAYVAGPAYVGGYGGCVPAPRVGQFAGQPWTNDVPCQPWTGVNY
jgi:hypothetical protein